MARSETAVADAGIADVGGQVSPPASTSEAAPARHAFFGKAQVVEAPPREEEDLGAGLEEAPDDDSQPDDADGEGLESSVDEDEGDGPDEAAEGDTPPGVEQWVATVTSAPQRINEVPAKQRGAVIEAIKAATEASATQARADYERAATIAYQKGMADAVAQRDQAAAVAEIDAFRESDPRGYVEWEDAHPDRAQAYRAYKARAAAPSGGNAVATIATSVAGIEAQLRAVPGALEAVMAKGPYQPTPEGLAKLTADAVEAIAEAKYAARTKADGPDQRKAAERKANAEAIKGLPKPAGTGGGGTDAELTPARLLQMSQAEVSALMETPRGVEQVNKAMAKHAKQFA